MNYRFSRNTL